MASTLKDNHVGSAPFTEYDIEVTPISKRGQWFTAQSTYKATSCDMKVNKTLGSSPGICTLSFCEVDGSNLPSTVLATTTFDGEDITDAGLGHFVTLALPQIAITSGTKYCITIEIPEVSNGLNLLGDIGFANPGGSQLFSVATGLWTTVDSVDNLFRVYGDTLPVKANTPGPVDPGSDIVLGTELSWVDGGNSDTYDVYFGTSGNAVLVSEAQEGLTYIVSQDLKYGTSYEWRIDSTNQIGTTTGDTWTFSTLAFDKWPRPTGIGADGSGTPLGLNNMMTIRKLVAAANNKIWIEDI